MLNKIVTEELCEKEALEEIEMVSCSSKVEIDDSFVDNLLCVLAESERDIAKGNVREMKEAFDNIRIELLEKTSAVF